MRDILENMSESDKERIREMPKGLVLGLHFDLGMHIRNHYGLLQGNDRLLRAACGEKSFCDPDDASANILEALWDALQKSVG